MKSNLILDLSPCIRKRKSTVNRRSKDNLGRVQLTGDLQEVMRLLVNAPEQPGVPETELCEDMLEKLIQNSSSLRPLKGEVDLSFPVKVPVPINRQLQTEHYEAYERVFAACLCHLEQIYSPVLYRYLLICAGIFPKVDHKPIMEYIARWAGSIPRLLDVLLLSEALLLRFLTKGVAIQYLSVLLRMPGAQSEEEKDKIEESFVRAATSIIQSRFSIVSTYSIESFTFLFSLKMIRKGETLQKFTSHVLEAWRGLLNRQEVTDLCYYFSHRGMLKNCPWLSKNPSMSIRSKLKSWFQILKEFLGCRDEPEEEFSFSFNLKMSISLQPDQTKKHRLSMEYAQNKGILVENVIRIETTQGRCQILLSHDSAEIVGSKKQKQPQKIKNLKFWSRITLEISNTQKDHSQISFITHNIKLSQHLGGNITQISLEFTHFTLYKDILFEDLRNRQIVFTDPSQLITYNAGCQLKITAVSLIQSMPLLRKFPFQHFYALVLEILNTIKDQQILKWAYLSTLRVSVALMEGSTQKRRKESLNLNQLQPISNQIRSMNSFYRTISNNFEIRRLDEGLFQYQIIQLKDLAKECLMTKEFYNFLLSAYLTKPIFQKFSKEDQNATLSFLDECISSSEHFRLDVENTSQGIFQHLLCLVSECPSKTDPNSRILNLCDSIIKTHSLSNILVEKITHYWYMGQINSLIRQHFQALVNDLAHCFHFDVMDSRKSHLRIITKFLLFNSKMDNQLFKFCDKDAKLKILNFFAFVEPSKQHSLTIIALLNSVSVVECSSMIDWLICYLKNQLFELKRIQNQRQNDFLTNFYSILKIVLKCWNSNLLAEEREDIFSKILQFLDFVRKGERSPECYSVVSADYFVRFLVDYILNQIEQFGNNLFERVVSTFSKMPQASLLEFFVNYRREAGINVRMLGFPLRRIQMRKIPLNCLCLVLQYIYETLIIVLPFQRSPQLLLLIDYATSYIAFIARHYQSSVKKCLYYTYPKIYSSQQYKKKASLLQIMEQIDSNPLRQLKGGVYFKMVLIVLVLIEIQPKTQLLDVVKLLLLPEVETKAKNQKIDRLANDFNLGPIYRRERIIQISLAEVDKEHSDYHQSHQHQITLNEEKDLSPFIMDFFVMRGVKYLQQTQEKHAVLNQFQDNFAALLAKCILENASMLDHYKSQSKLRIQSLDELKRLKNNFSPETTQSPFLELSSPSKTMNSLPEQEQQFSNAEKYFFINLSSEKKLPEIESQQRSPKTAQKSRSPLLSARQLSQSRKKEQIMELMQSRNSSWIQICTQEGYFKRFNEQAKELLLVELLHMYFVEQSRQNITSIGQANQAERLFKDHTKRIKQLQDHCVNLNEFEEERRDVRKITPYTSKVSPIMLLLPNAFPNCATPFTSLLNKQICQVRLNLESILLMKEDEMQAKLQPSIFQFDNLDIQEEEEELSLRSKPSQQGKESAAYCQLIVNIEAFFCIWSLEQDRILMRGELKPQNTSLEYLSYGTPVCNLSQNHSCIFTIFYSEIQQILYRKFNQIPSNSIQLFCKAGKSYFITFYLNRLLEEFLQKLGKMVEVKIVRDLTKQFQKLNYTQKWVNGELSNFDYLMMVNKYSGRSYNDLNQYYVFPWVLADYSSEFLDLNNRDVYRDLTKPIGALNPQKLKKYQDRFDTQTSDTGYYLYGSHYSTSLFIFYYLVRLEPFSSLHRSMQGNQWDSPDRLFNSIKNMWECLMNESVTSDIKEAIPELYYLPCILKNTSQFDFGFKQTGEAVGNVELPRWAATAEIFITKMREALESDYVSENLPHWIDLIFGKHQKSIEKNNLFHPLSYEDNINLTKVPKKALDPLICQISFFGQNPMRLFKREHRGKRKEAELFPNEDAQFFDLPLSKYVAKLKHHNHQFILELRSSRRADLINYISISGDRVSQEIIQSSLDLDLKNPFPPKESPTLEVKLRHYNQYLLLNGLPIKSLTLSFPFQQTAFNQIYLVCYGHDGVRLYNWQLEELWRSPSQQVISVYLEPTFMLYSVGGGQLRLLKFTNLKEKILFECDCFHIMFEVAKLGRPKGNYLQLRILIVVDRKQMAMIHYGYSLAEAVSDR